MCLEGIVVWTVLKGKGVATATSPPSHVGFFLPLKTSSMTRARQFKPRSMAFVCDLGSATNQHVAFSSLTLIYHPPQQGALAFRARCKTQACIGTAVATRVS